jgi:hypothetical protein
MLDAVTYTWGPWMYNNLMYVKAKVYRLVSAIYREVYNTNTWIFLNTLDVPISTHSFIDSGISDTNIRWRATLYPAVFINPLTSDRKTKHLPYLSMEVKVHDLETHDITDWINEVKWNGPFEPTLKDIVTLWSCQRGICLFDRYTSLQVSAITNLGVTINKGLNDS